MDKSKEYPICALTDPSPNGKDWGKCPECGTDMPVWSRPTCYGKRTK